MLCENGVAQILHMCSVVFEQHAEIPVETKAVSFFVLAPELAYAATVELFFEQLNGCSCLPGWNYYHDYSFPAV